MDSPSSKPEKTLIPNAFVYCGFVVKSLSQMPNLDLQMLGRGVASEKAISHENHGTLSDLDSALILIWRRLHQRLHLLSKNQRLQAEQIRQPGTRRPCCDKSTCTSSTESREIAMSCGVAVTLMIQVL